MKLLHHAPSKDWRPPTHSPVSSRPQHDETLSGSRARLADWPFAASSCIQIPARIRTCWVCQNGKARPSRAPTLNRLGLRALVSKKIARCRCCPHDLRRSRYHQFPVRGKRETVVSRDLAAAQRWQTDSVTAEFSISDHEVDQCHHPLKQHSSTTPYVSGSPSFGRGVLDLHLLIGAYPP